MAYILHQQRKVISIFRRKRYTGSSYTGIFPIYINSVQIKLVYHPFTICGKRHTCTICLCHLTKPTASPPAYGQQNFQRRFFFTQPYYHLQTWFIIYTYSFEIICNMPERIINMSQTCRIRRTFSP